MPLACRQSSFSTWNLAVSLLMAVGTKLRSAPDGSYSTRKACRHDSLSLINLSSVNVPLIYISLWGWLRGGGGEGEDGFFLFFFFFCFVVFVVVVVVVSGGLSGGNRVFLLFLLLLLFVCFSFSLSVPLISNTRRT